MRGGSANQGQVDLPAFALEYPELFQPTSFIALWKSDTNTLRLLPIPREAYELVKDSPQINKVGFVLYKE